MKPTKPTPKRFYTFCIIMLSPFLAAAVFMFLGESDGAAPIPPAVKFFYFLMCLIGACGIKYSLRRTPEYDLSLVEFLAFLGLEGSSDQVNEKIIRERAERERAQEGGAMPAEQLAFARAVAAAAGYIESSEDMSPDLMYAIRQQLRRLSSGSTALENELLEIFRTGAGNWDQMCLFRRDPGRLSVFFGVLAEIITGDAVVSDDEKARFSEVAAHFGYSADEAMGMLHDSGRFRRFWNQGERQAQSGGMSYNDALRTLNVSSLTNNREIRQAYLRLAQRYHPDKVRNRGFSEDVVAIYRKKFELISEAWNIVKARRGDLIRLTAGTQ